MPIKRINLGQRPDDGTGDALRVAFEKTNDNFDDLASAILAKLLTHPNFAPLRHEHENNVARYVADIPPNVPPSRLGAMWIDAATSKIYLATGTSSVSDRREIAFVA